MEQAYRVVEDAEAEAQEHVVAMQTPFHGGRVWRERKPSTEIARVLASKRSESALQSAAMPMCSCVGRQSAPRSGRLAHTGRDESAPQLDSRAGHDICAMSHLGWCKQHKRDKA